MRRIILIILALLLFPFVPSNIYARSGCCSHHGGVCGCGCCDGIPLSSTCAPYYPQCSQPVYISPTTIPTIKPTIKPALTPTQKPTPSPTDTPSQTLNELPINTPEVEATSTENSVDPTSKSPSELLSAGETAGVIIFLIFLIGLPVFIIVEIIKFIKSKFNM